MVGEKEKKMRHTFFKWLLISVLLVMISGCATIQEVHERTHFFIAIADGNIQEVQRWLNSGVDVNMRNDKNVTPLMFAALQGKIEIAKILIANGADVNAKGVFDTTALFFAAHSGQTELVKILLDNGADVNAKDEKGRTALT